MARRKLMDETILEIYRRMYRVATPPADFDELVANAKVNERGQKDIGYMNYELESSVADSIIEEVIKEHKVPKHLKGTFRFSVILGCSPKDKAS